MPWLTRDDQVLAAVDLAARVRRRPTGGGSVTVVAEARLLQLLALPPGFDVAWCQPPVREAPCPGMKVLVVRGIGRKSVLRSAAPHGRRAILVAPPASFDRWQLRVGDRLEVRGLQEVTG